jgi:hypothetical protein
LLAFKSPAAIVRDFRLELHARLPARELDAGALKTALDGRNAEYRRPLFPSLEFRDGAPTRRRVSKGPESYWRRCSTNSVPKRNRVAPNFRT